MGNYVSKNSRWPQRLHLWSRNSRRAELSEYSRGVKSRSKHIWKSTTAFQSSYWKPTTVKHEILTASEMSVAAYRVVKKSVCRSCSRVASETTAKAAVSASALRVRQRAEDVATACTYATNAWRQSHNQSG